MPEDFYKVGPVGQRQFDQVGLRALEHDWAARLGEPSDDLIQRSQFNLFHDIGVHLFGRNSRQASEYAMSFMERRKPVTPVRSLGDAQRCLPFRFSKQSLLQDRRENHYSRAPNQIIPEVTDVRRCERDEHECLCKERPKKHRCVLRIVPLVISRWRNNRLSKTAEPRSRREVRAQNLTSAQ